MRGGHYKRVIFIVYEGWPHYRPAHETPFKKMANDDGPTLNIWLGSLVILGHPDQYC